MCGGTWALLIPSVAVTFGNTPAAAMVHLLSLPEKLAPGLPCLSWAPLMRDSWSTMAL